MSVSRSNCLSYRHGSTTVSPSSRMASVEPPPRTIICSTIWKPSTPMRSWIMHANPPGSLAMIPGPWTLCSAIAGCSSHKWMDLQQRNLWGDGDQIIEGIGPHLIGDGRKQPRAADKSTYPLNGCDERAESQESQVQIRYPAGHSGHFPRRCDFARGS